MSPAHILPLAGILRDISPQLHPSAESSRTFNIKLTYFSGDFQFVLS